MGQNYTRQDTGNNINAGNVIDPNVLDSEFNQIEAFASTSGHTHDGTSGEGGPILHVGPAQDLVVSATQVTPKTNNTLDLGTTSSKFKDLHVGRIFSEELIRPEAYGAVGDGTTNDATALQNAINAAIAADATLFLDNQYYSASTLTIDGGITIRGRRPIGEAGSLDFVSGFVFAAGAGLHIIKDASVSTTTQWVGLYDFFVRDNQATTAPADRFSWDDTPLILSHRSSDWDVSRVFVYGADRRRYGAIFGDQDTIWNSRFSNCRFISCQIGAIFGGTNDATDMFVVNNTFDQTKICGAILRNWVGGCFHGNSIENTQGPVGLYLQSTSSRTKNTSIVGNYIFNNSQSNSDLDGSAGIQIGGDLVFSDFTTPSTLEITSTNKPWTITVSDNYLVNPDCRYAVVTHGERSCRILHNTVQSNTSTDTNDINHTADAVGTIIFRNTNQGSGLVDLVTESSSNTHVTFPTKISGTGRMSPTFSGIDFTADGDLSFDDVGQVTAAGILMGEDVGGFKYTGRVWTKRVTGTGGVWTTLFDTATEFPAGGKGIATLKIAIEQTNGNNQSIHKVLVNSPLFDAAGSVDEAANFSVDYELPAVARDLQSFQISGSAFQVRRTNSWQATILIEAVDFPFGDS